MNIHGIQSVGTLTQEAGGFATLTGSFTGSFKGDGSQLTNLPITPTDTGSLVTTASFNAYTASQDTKNSTLGTYTASVDTKFSNIGSQSASWDNTSLNAFTASQDTKNSTLATYTASIDTKFSTLGTQSGSWITESETGSFARTNVDNNFSVNQTFTNITAVSASFTYVQTTYETSSIIYSSGSNQLGDELSDIQTLSGSVRVQGSLTVNGTQVQTSSVDITSLNAFTASQETKNATLGSLTGSFATTGSNTFIGNQTLTGSLFISGNINMVNGADIVTHHVRAQGSNGLELQTSAGTIIVSMGAGGGTQATFVGAVSANSISASTINGLGDPLAFSTSVDSRLDGLAAATSSYVTSAITASSLVTASVNLNTITFTKGDASTFNITVNTGSGTTTDLTSLNAFTASQETKNSTLGGLTGSFATTGSNTFIGNQTILGTSNLISGSTQMRGTTFSIEDNTSTTKFQVNSSTQQVISNYPLTVNATFTASLQEGYAWVGNASNVSTLVATSSFGGATINTGSFATTGSNNFIGNQTITGSLILSSSATTELQVIGNSEFTGSMTGKVNPLVVTGTTASLDFSLGNMFTLTLPSSSTTYFNPANIKAGQTINVQLTQQTPGTGSVSFAPSIKFAGGADYQATATGSAVDLVTFISLDGTNILATSIKNFL
jgi:hypothetical protein